MYKLTKPDGFDFYSGTINYRDAIGTTIRVADYDPPEQGPCGRGLHASKNPNDCFVAAQIPCAAFRVRGIGKLAGDAQKTRYQALRVIEEITDLDALFGWRYSEAINPVHPFKILCPEVTMDHIKLVRQWASVRASVWDSVRDSVRASVWDSVRASVWASMGASVRASVRDFVGVSVGVSMWDSVWAYIGSMFPNTKNWKYAPKIKGYPYQSCVDLWKQGLVPSFAGTIWRLHGGENGKIVWEDRKSE